MKDIIPLGYTCGITFSLQALKIKKETSLFEWFRSDSLSTITKIVNSIKENIDNSIIIQKENFVGYFDNNSDIYSVHYSVNEFKEIFIRRAQRFLDKIKTSKSIVFVRTEESHLMNSSSIDDLKNFKEVIISINPDINIDFLLIDFIDDESKFVKKDLPFLTHVWFPSKDKIDEHLQKDPIFYNFLQDKLHNLDCNMEKNGIFFHDRSHI
jgi:hypothetical protein